MKKSLLLIFVLFLCSATFAQQATTFILVRHSEKASDGTNDPSLSQAGLQRSNELAALLERQDVDGLYSTPYKRTRETLTPVARAKGLEVKSYDPYAGDELLRKLLAEQAGKTIMISGHSNTIPALGNRLLGKEVFTQFEDNDYSNLIIIVADELGKGTLIRLSF